jgi:hypothetical protein
MTGITAFESCQVKNTIRSPHALMEKYPMYIPDLLFYSSVIILRQPVRVYLLPGRIKL